MWACILQKWIYERLGARPLKHAIGRLLIDKLAEDVLKAGNSHPVGVTSETKLVNGEIKFVLIDDSADGPKEVHPTNASAQQAPFSSGVA